MARYTCPSCGAAFNGKKCRACLYEHFSEEITHGNHTHKGEPLVIDAPARRPIKRKDPFGCEKKSRRRKHPLMGLLVILFLINTFLPLVRDWGLELEAMEAAAPEPMPQGLVVLHQEGPITISIQPEQLTDFADGLGIWVENGSDHDVYISPKYVTANGFVMRRSSLYVDAAEGSYGLGSLYLDDEELEDARITDLQELTFVLEVVDDEDYTVLFETDPITLSATGRPLEQETDFDGTALIDEGGLRMHYLDYAYDQDYPKFENGALRFYLENDTEDYLRVNSLETTVGGAQADLYLWADLPANSRAVVRLELYALEELDWTTPSELGDLTMTVEFWDPDNYSASAREYTVTVPMVDMG